MSQCNDVAMYRKPCIDVTEFCNDLCIGHNVAMIRDTFVALWCSPIHAEPTGFAVFTLVRWNFPSNLPKVNEHLLSYISILKEI
jgi:hypothetical protein